MKVNKALILFALVIVYVFVAGCGSKTPKTTTTHQEFGNATVMFSEVYEECIANNNTQGALDAVETYRYLCAFYCEEVYYEDFKNKKYNNMNFDIGELQLAVAAYNEYNDGSAVDVEVDWICQFNLCTQEQHDAVDDYVEWYHKAQNGHYEGTIKEYSDKFGAAYDEIKQNNDIPHPPAYDRLTPAQFMEVQKYMADPNYQVDISVWE